MVYIYDSNYLEITNKNREQVAPLLFDIYLNRTIQIIV